MGQRILHMQYTHSSDETVQSPYILYTLLSGHSLHQRGVLDGLDGEECAGSASGVRDTSQPRRGVERFVPGVRDHAADRLSVAAAFSTTGRDGDGGAEPASARESAADLGGGGAADRTVAARASGLGRTQAGGVAGAARHDGAGGDGASGAGAAGSGAGPRVAAAGHQPLRTRATQPAMADGLQGPEGGPGSHRSTECAGRPQPLCGGVGADRQHARRSRAPSGWKVSSAATVFPKPC